jgi:hypothetical protein
MMQVASMHLAWAMDAGRIVIYPESWGTRWVNDPACGKNPNPGCFFLPLTNCTPEPGANIVTSPNDLGGLSYIPVFVQDMLKNSIVEPTAYYHYWMAHSICYFTRLNNRTEIAVKQIMADAGVLKTWEETGFDVAMHIRHGDKGSDMVLIDDPDYASILDLIRKLHKDNLTVFLASDDPRSFQFFANQTGIQLYGIRTPWPGEYHYRSGLFYLADVWAAINAAFTIGTWKSHYDRWLRSLMDVAFGHSSVPFFEVGKMSCFSATHCKKLHRPFFPMT